MGSGMIRAVRATIATRTWTVTDLGVQHTVTGEQALAMLDAMPDFDKMLAALPGAKDFTDRRCDRVLQALRKAGLATYDKATRTWNRVEERRA